MLRIIIAAHSAHPNSKVAFHGKGHVATVTGVHTASSKPADTMLTIVPSSEFTWKAATVVRGQVGNASLGLPWQGWYSSNYNGNSTAPTLVFDGAVPGKAGATFGWLFIPQQQPGGSAGRLPVASLKINSADANGTVSATVAIGGKHDDVTLALGRAPAPPPPCAANEERICGVRKAWPKSLTCPDGKPALLRGPEPTIECFDVNHAGGIYICVMDAQARGWTSSQSQGTTARVAAMSTALRIGITPPRSRGHTGQAQRPRSDRIAPLLSALELVPGRSCVSACRRRTFAQRSPTYAKVAATSLVLPFPRTFVCQAKRMMTRSALRRSSNRSCLCRRPAWTVPLA